MSDLSKYRKLLDSLKIEYNLSQLSGGEAEELARMHRAPSAAKSRQYLYVGQTYFHFDHFGRFVGLEHSVFEERNEPNSTGNSAPATQILQDNSTDGETGGGGEESQGDT